MRRARVLQTMDTPELVKVNEPIAVDMLKMACGTVVVPVGVGRRLGTAIWSGGVEPGIGRSYGQSCHPASHSRRDMPGRWTR